MPPIKNPHRSHRDYKIKINEYINSEYKNKKKENTYIKSASLFSMYLCLLLFCESLF